MSSLLQTLVREIHDGDLLALLDELECAVPVASRMALRIPLIGLLMQFVYPYGPEKRIPITLDSVLETPILETRVGKLPDGSLRELCMELAVLSGRALEFYQGCKVYVLLNKAIPRHVASKKPSANALRWEAVVRQRRSNR